MGQYSSYGHCRGFLKRQSPETEVGRVLIWCGSGEILTTVAIKESYKMLIDQNLFQQTIDYSYNGICINHPKEWYIFIFIKRKT